MTTHIRFHTTVHKWHHIKEEGICIPINTTVLVSDGYEVFPAFIDSMLEWRFTNQDLCEDQDFDVIFWMLLPPPPEEINGANYHEK